MFYPFRHLRKYIILWEFLFLLTNLTPISICNFRTCPIQSQPRSHPCPDSRSIRRMSGQETRARSAVFFPARTPTCPNPSNHRRWRYAGDRGQWAAAPPRLVLTLAGRQRIPGGMGLRALRLMSSALLRTSSSTRGGMTVAFSDM